MSSFTGSVQTAPGDYFLCFPNELFPALGAGNGDLALSPGDTDPLAAVGAIVIAVLPIPDAVQDLQKPAILLIAAVGVPGEHAENGPEHQHIG